MRPLQVLAVTLAITFGVTMATEARAQAVDALIPGCEDLETEEGAKAPPKEAMNEARERYERGRQLYSDGAFEQSLLEFERAYQLAPAARILYNIAQVAMLMNDYPKAICAFRGYLVTEKASDDRRDQVNKELEKLAGRVAYIDIEVNVGGADVRLDGIDIGKSPLQKPVMVNAGRHRVSARVQGRLPADDSVVLAGQDRRTLKLELKTMPKSRPSDTPVPSPMPGGGPGPDRGPEEPSYVWVGWVVTGTLAAAAIGTGVGALLATNKLGDLRETPGVTTGELDDQTSSARGLGIATDVLAASAIVAGGVTLYFQLTEGDGGEMVEARVSPTGLSLQGRF